MTALATILLSIAGEVAAPIIKKVLTDRIGGAGGEIAGQVVDVIAEKVGVPTDKLQDLAEQKPAEVQAAIAAAEPEAAELVLAYVESQRLMNETMKAEMDKGGPVWTWAWRPAGMWLFLGLVVFYVVGAPLINLLLRLGHATAELGLIVDVGTFVTLFITYLGLYMGGHTAKAVLARGADK